MKTATAASTDSVALKARNISPIERFSRTYIKAISLVIPYYLEAKKDDTPESHRQAAYEWGYRVGDPEIVGALRLQGEIAQAVYYKTTKNKKYNPTSWNGPGGILDSWGDLVESELGAIDRQAGRPSKY